MIIMRFYVRHFVWDEIERRRRWMTSGGKSGVCIVLTLLQKHLEGSSEDNAECVSLEERSSVFTLRLESWGCYVEAGVCTRKVNIFQVRRRFISFPILGTYSCLLSWHCADYITTSLLFTRLSDEFDPWGRHLYEFAALVWTFSPRNVDILSLIYLWRG